MISTSEQRRAALGSLVAQLGYSQEMIRHGFPVWVRGQVCPVDVAAFSRALPEPHDQTSSAIAGFDVGQAAGIEQHFETARALAAPVAAIAGDSAIDLWSVEAATQGAHLFRLSYEDAEAPPDALVRQLGPRNLLAAKSSTYQQALFPTDVAGLLQAARKDSANRLIQIVENAAVHLSAEQTPKTASAKQQELARVSRLLVGAMAALMVSDKVLVDRGQGSGTILGRAQERFSNYFGWTQMLSVSDHNDLLWAIDELGRDVSYAGLDPVVVSSVYESAILDAASRADFGVFYTPPGLARRILAQLPLEELAPECRQILDPACGSGTFLLAAYDRLRHIAPLELDLIDVHNDTSKRLTGFDIDPLAVEVARLALLLNAMPAGNGWHVEQRDALDTVAPGAATVVVSNPPWRDLRSDHGRRVQIADRFVLRMLQMLEPGGFLAVVLPAGWLSSGTSRPARKQLEEQCGLFEVWRLPQDTFPGADMDATVVFARRDQPAGQYVFRRVRRLPGWRTRFFDVDVAADETYVADQAGRLSPDAWLHGPLDRYREILTALPSLGTIAAVSKGPVPTPPVSERGGSGQFLWLPTMGGTKAYVRPADDLLARVRYPEEFNWREDDGTQYLRPKLMVSGVRNPDIPWRLKVLPDPDCGIIPRDSMLAVIPHDVSKDRVFAICALLGSSVASCWVDTLNTGRSITVKLLRGMPIPPPGEEWKRLADSGRRVVEMAERGALTAEALVEVDQLVVSAYGLPDEVQVSLADHFAGVPSPEGGTRYPAKERTLERVGTETIRAFGTVLDLDGDRLRIWISGVTAEEGEWIAMPSTFPGSQLRAGATFDVEIPGRDIMRARFTYQTESYLDFEDLLVGSETTA
jgi:SAM-dependent methyltransferase